MSALLKLEQPLVDLKTMAGLLGHMSTSERTADGCAEVGEEHCSHSDDPVGVPRRYPPHGGKARSTRTRPRSMMKR
jgi:hypothetical protein